VLGRPERCRSAHAFLREYGYKRLDFWANLLRRGRRTLHVVEPVDDDVRQHPRQPGHGHCPRQEYAQPRPTFSLSISPIVLSSVSLSSYCSCLHIDRHTA
jgi:hypothetical protein